MVLIRSAYGLCVLLIVGWPNQSAGKVILNARGVTKDNIRHFTRVGVRKPDETDAYLRNLQ